MIAVEDVKKKMDASIEALKRELNDEMKAYAERTFGSMKPCAVNMKCERLCVPTAIAHA